MKKSRKIKFIFKTETPTASAGVKFIEKYRESSYLFI